MGPPGVLVRHERDSDYPTSGGKREVISISCKIGTRSGQEIYGFITLNSGNSGSSGISGYFRQFQKVYISNKHLLETLSIACLIRHDVMKGSTTNTSIYTHLI